MPCTPPIASIILKLASISSARWKNLRPRETASNVNFYRIANPDQTATASLQLDRFTSPTSKVNTRTWLEAALYLAAKLHLGTAFIDRFSCGSFPPECKLVFGHSQLSLHYAINPPRTNNCSYRATPLLKWRHLAFIAELAGKVSFRNRYTSYRGDHNFMIAKFSQGGMDTLVAYTQQDVVLSLTTRKHSLFIRFHTELYQWAKYSKKSRLKKVGPEDS